MKQETRRLADFIDETYISRTYSCRIHEFDDEYMNLHMTLLMMDSAAGKKNRMSTALDDVRAVVKGFTYEQLLEEKVQNDQPSGPQYRPLPIPVRATLRRMNAALKKGEQE